jgi:histidinol dehydrogenase
LIDCRDFASDDYREVVPRGEFDVAAATAVVAPICEAVRVEGETALRRYSAQFDRVVPDQLRLDPAQLEHAANQLTPTLRAAFATAIERRRQVCEREAIADRRVDLDPGAAVTIRSIPVDRVGLYVPGGLAPLASSVIMNVVPAQVAGVRSLALATPPQAAFAGLPHPTVLALCHLLGINEVYAVGGAQAIAMFAYGVEGLCPSVDLVTGPGNIYVVAAKRLLKGVVGIDSEAGPTEVCILADSTASPQFIAADLVSQAEHDPSAGAVLVSDDADLIAQVEVELADLVARTLHRERVEMALAGAQSAAILVRDLTQGIAVANAYAAEHLEIMTANASAVAAQITNAGAIFVGDYAPVSLGDYSAGSTHVLPTSGTARHSSGLNVASFIKTVHVIDYDAAALAKIAPEIEAFALAENLPGHAQAIAVRSGEHRNLENQEGGDPLTPASSLGGRP